MVRIVPAATTDALMIVVALVCVHSAVSGQLPKGAMHSGSVRKRRVTSTLVLLTGLSLLVLPSSAHVVRLLPQPTKPWTPWRTVASYRDVM